MRISNVCSLILSAHFASLRVVDNLYTYFIGHCHQGDLVGPMHSTLHSTETKGSNTWVLIYKNVLQTS